MAAPAYDEALAAEILPSEAALARNVWPRRADTQELAPICGDRRAFRRVPYESFLAARLPSAAPQGDAA